MKREYDVIIERDEDGYYVATVPELRGCHAQSRSHDALLARVREAIALCLEEQMDQHSGNVFVGVQRVSLA